MSLVFYNLDRHAQALVLKYRDKDVFSETHKMRMAVAYGLERFWGEYLRLQRDGRTNEADYWWDTWHKLIEIMEQGTGITVPGAVRIVDLNDKDSTAALQAVRQLWDEENFPMAERKVVLAVLTQLCDSMVWWSQRYKKRREQAGEEHEQQQTD